MKGGFTTKALSEMKPGVTGIVLADASGFKVGQTITLGGQEKHVVMGITASYPQSVF